MNRRTRRIYEYMTVEEKKEAEKLLKENREKLHHEFTKAGHTYPKIVTEVISDTLDKWAVEIDELQSDIENGVGITADGF